MAYTVIRTINGRRYKYVQESYRDGNGKPRTRYLSCTPLDAIPRKKKRGGGGGGGLGGLTMGTFLLGGLLVAAKAMQGELGPPGGKPQRDNYRYHPADPRARVNMTAKELKLDVLRTRWQREDDEARAYARQYSTPAAIAWKAVFAEARKAELVAQNARQVQAAKEWNERHGRDKLAIVKDAVAKAEATVPGVTEDGFGAPPAEAA